ncbi:MAG: hypothetical protein KDB03_06660 [Planctomycetales bacterium]|nr:hypothetical protein [Planctomycetales bacterium]
MKPQAQTLFWQSHLTQLWLIYLPLAALIPLLFFISSDDWSLGRSLPIGLGLTITLLSTLRSLRNCEANPPDSRLPKLVSIYAVAIIFCLLAAYYLRPIFACLSIVLFYALWCLIHRGAKHWFAAVACSVMLAVSIITPTIFTESFFEFIASSFSAVLDGLEIPNLLRGTTVGVEHRLYRVEETFGTFSSIHLLLVVTFGMLINLARNFVVAAATIALTPILLWGFSVGKLLISYQTLRQAAVASDSGGVSDVFFIIIFAAMVLLLIVLFRTLFEPVPVIGEDFTKLFAGLDNFLCWPLQNPYEQAKTEKENRSKSFSDSAPPLSVASLQAWLLRIAPLASSLAAGCGFCAVAACLLHSASAGQLPSEKPKLNAHIGSWNEQSLAPDQVLRGDNQYLWLYQSESLTTMVVLSEGRDNQLLATDLLPFTQGWNIARQIGQRKLGQLIKLRNELGGTAYGCIKTNPADSSIETATLWQIFSGSAMFRRANSICVQLRFFCDAGAELTESQEASLNDFVNSVSNELLPTSEGT